MKIFVSENWQDYFNSQQLSLLANNEHMKFFERLNKNKTFKTLLKSQLVFQAMNFKFHCAILNLTLIILNLILFPEYTLMKQSTHLF